MQCPRGSAEPAAFRRPFRRPGSPPGCFGLERCQRRRRGALRSPREQELVRSRGSPAKRRRGSRRFHCPADRGSGGGFPGTCQGVPTRGRAAAPGYSLWGQTRSLPFETFEKLQFEISSNVSVFHASRLYQSWSLSLGAVPEEKGGGLRVQHPPHWAPSGPLGGT